MMSYETLRAAFQQGDWLDLTVNGETRKVEVVGHKAERLFDGNPAVRVYEQGRGTVLYSESELRLMGAKGRSKAEQNCFLGAEEAAKHGHHLGDWTRHR